MTRVALLVALLLPSSATAMPVRDADLCQRVLLCTLVASGCGSPPVYITACP